MTVRMKTKAEPGTRALDVVALADLQVDRSYQRALDQNLVERILSEWDFVAADALTISRREDGSQWIVNGQHRAAAAALAGEPEMLAFVYEGLTVEQEAGLRLKANNRRADTAQERFHAQVVQGNEESRAIVALLAEFDAHINRSPTKSQGINCVSTIETLYRDDELLFRKTLMAVKEAYGGISGESAGTLVLRGTYWFLRVHAGAFVWRDLIAKMRTSGVDEMTRRALSFKSVNGGSEWLNYYRALVEGYNYRKTEYNRLEMRTAYSVSLERGKGWPRKGPS